MFGRAYAVQASGDVGWGLGVGTAAIGQEVERVPCVVAQEQDEQDQGVDKVADACTHRPSVSRTTDEITTAARPSGAEQTSNKKPSVHAAFAESWQHRGGKSRASSSAHSRWCLVWGHTLHGEGEHDLHATLGSLGTATSLSTLSSRPSSHGVLATHTIAKHELGNDVEDHEAVAVQASTAGCQEDGANAHQGHSGD